MDDPAAGNWGPSGDNPLGGGASTGPRGPRGAAFYNFMQDQLNRAGEPMGRKGAPAAFQGGPLAGMTPGQAEAHLADQWDQMSPDAQSNFGPTDSQPTSSAAPAPAAQSDDPQAALRTAKSPMTHDFDAIPPGQVYMPAPATVPAANGVQSPGNADDGSFGPDPDGDLAKLRSAGVVGQNETISDPQKFKDAVATVNSRAYSAPGAVTPPALAGATPPQSVAPVSTTPPYGDAGRPPVPSPANNFTVTPQMVSAATAAPSPAAPAGASAYQAPAVVPPPALGGTINGLPGDQVISGMKAQNSANDVAMGKTPPVPVIGSGFGMAPSDASGAGKYAGPTPSAPASAGASIVGDTDPLTGKKRSSPVMS